MQPFVPYRLAILRRPNEREPIGDGWPIGPYEASPQRIISSRCRLPGSDFPEVLSFRRVIWQAAFLLSFAFCDGSVRKMLRDRNSCAEPECHQGRIRTRLPQWRSPSSPSLALGLVRFGPVPYATSVLFARRIEHGVSRLGVFLSNHDAEHRFPKE